jgi:hypothetical protein
MSSRSSKLILAPASPARTARAPAQKSVPDAPPTNEGWYAAPTTTGRDADLQLLSGAGDAPLASQSRYATAATTARDDDPATPQELLSPDPLEVFARSGYRPPHLRHQALKHPSVDSSQLTIKTSRSDGPKPVMVTLNSREAEPSIATPVSSSMPDHLTRLARIQFLAEDIQRQSGKHNDVLRALRLTFNKDELKIVIPRRIVERSPDTQLEQCRFAFHPDYAAHLLGVMRMSSKVLNDFLQAAGSKQRFSYSTSKYYEGLAFEKILLLEWPAQTVAMSFERRILGRIATASEAINQFLHKTIEEPRHGKPHTVASALLDSTSASQNTTAAHGIRPTITSPKREDSIWTGEVMEQVRSALYSTITEDCDEPLTTIASVQQQDFDQAMSPRSIDHSATETRTDASDKPMQSPSTSRPAQRSQDPSASPNSSSSDACVIGEAPLQPHPTQSVTITPTTHRPPIAEQALQLCDADEASIKLQAGNHTLAV